MSEATATTKMKDRACCFCGSSEDNELEYGKIYEQDGLVTHYYCLLLSSNMEQRGSDSEGILGFLTSDIQKELRRGKRLVCSYCKKNGATLGCCNIKCKKIFHFPCGLRAGSLHQFFGEFRSYCISHRPKQKINEKTKNELEGVEGAVCCICYEAVNAEDFINTLWAPCCKKNTWFHRKCIQQLAQSAGYFFKCPLCNNKQEFEQAMKENGIFIPCQDASWELVPNAFNELLHRHDQCDAIICLCPKGRKYTSKNVKWELVLCGVCGSQGTHTACGQLKWGVRNWECNECSSILCHSKVEEDDTSKSTSSQEDEDSDSEDSDTDISVGQYSPVPPSLNCEYENECNSPESPPDISAVKIRPGPRSFKIKQEIYANTLMERMSNNVESSCDKDNTTLSIAETRSESLVLEKSASSSNLSNPPGNEDAHKDISDNDIIMVDSDDEPEIVQQEVPEEKCVTNELSIQTANIGSSVKDIVVEVISCDTVQENGSIEPKSELEVMEDVSDNTASIKAISSEITTEDSSASIETNDDEDPIMNIKIVNVTSLPPEVFASVADSNNEQSTTSLHPPIDQKSIPLTIEPSLPSLAPTQSDSSLKRKPDDVCVVNNGSNDFTIEKCKKLRSDNFENASTSISSSIATPICSIVPLPKVGIPPLSSLIPQKMNYGTVPLRNILPKPDTKGNVNPTIVNNVESNLLLKRHRSEIISQKLQQEQSNNASKNFERHSFPRSTIQGAVNGCVKTDLPITSPIFIQLPNNVTISNTFTMPQQNTEKKPVVLKESNVCNSSNSASKQNTGPVIVQNEQHIKSNAKQNTATNESITINNVPNTVKSQLTNNPRILQMRNAVEIPGIGFMTPTNNNQPNTDRCHGDAGTSPATESGSADANNSCADATNQTTACSHPEPSSSESAESVQPVGEEDLSNTIFTGSHRRSGCHIDAVSQKENNTCDRARMIPEYVLLRDLKFRVCGTDNLQMILYDTFSVNIDVPQPPKRKTNVCSPKRVPSHVLDDLKYPTHDSPNSKTFVENGNENAHDDLKENRVPGGRMENINRDASYVSGISGNNQVISKESKENQKQLELSATAVQVSTELTCNARYRNARVTETRNTNCKHDEMSAIKYSTKQGGGNHEENVRSYMLQHRNAISQDVDSVKLNGKLKHVRNLRSFETPDIPIKYSSEINSDNQECESHVNPEVSKITTRSAMKIIRSIKFDDASSSGKQTADKLRTDRCLRVSIDLDKIHNLIDAKPNLFSAKNRRYDVNLREYINSMKDDRDMKKVIIFPCKYSRDYKKSQASDNFKDTLVKDKVASYVTCTKVNSDVGKVLIHENSSVTKDSICDDSDETSKQLEKVFISDR